MLESELAYLFKSWGLPDGESAARHYMQKSDKDGGWAKPACPPSRAALLLLLRSRATERARVCVCVCVQGCFLLLRADGRVAASQDKSGGLEFLEFREHLWFIFESIYVKGVAPHVAHPSAPTIAHPPARPD